MTVQFQILKDDFNISPSVVIAIIDQTDIGMNFADIDQN